MTALRLDGAHAGWQQMHLPWISLSIIGTTARADSRSSLQASEFSLLATLLAPFPVVLEPCGTLAAMTSWTWRALLAVIILAAYLGCSQAGNSTYLVPLLPGSQTGPAPIFWVSAFTYCTPAVMYVG